MDPNHGVVIGIPRPHGPQEDTIGCRRQGAGKTLGYGAAIGRRILVDRRVARPPGRPVAAAVGYPRVPPRHGLVVIRVAQQPVAVLRLDEHADDGPGSPRGARIGQGRRRHTAQRQDSDDHWSSHGHYPTHSGFTGLGDYRPSAARSQAAPLRSRPLQRWP